LKKVFCFLLTIGVVLSLPRFVYAQVAHQPQFKLSSTYNRDTATVNQLIKTVQVLLNDGKLEQGIAYSQRARALAKAIHYTSGVAKSYLTEGRMLFYQGKYPECIDRIISGLLIARQGRDSVIQSFCLNMLGNSYGNMGDYPKSLGYFQAGMSLEEKMTVQPNLHWFYNNIGNIYMQQNNFSKALPYFHKAVEVEKRIKNLQALSFTTKNIGGAYALLHINDSAIYYFNQSLKYAEQSKNMLSIGEVYNNLASFYVLLKQYNAATIYSMKVYEISKKMGYMDMYSTNLISLGSINIGLKKYDIAESYLMEALAISKDMQSKSGVNSAFHELTVLYDAKGDFKKAYHYYKLFSDTKDSMLNKENSRLVMEMNTKYTTEKKEKEIELLKKNEEIQALELSKKKNELSSQRTISIGVFAGFILLMLVAILLFSRYRLKKKANDQLQQTYNVIEEKNIVIEKSNVFITDSITYAKRIQDAILPSPEDLHHLFADNFFIVYKPAHIVSGDFYWCSTQHDKIIFVVADCTGHGVPGAFMSMIGNTLLNEIVNEQKKTCTKEIAEMLDKKIVHALHQRSDSDQYDGMDISICSIDKGKQELSFTGAHHAMYAHQGELKKIKGDPYSIGGAQQQDTKLFTSQKIGYEKGQRFYFLTDGYCDQNGGATNKRFTSGKFELLLASIQQLSMEEQKIKLEATFDEWKGTAKQRDDILIAGIQC
jgi:tetratricopeptide (TPR) repeat protein/serine phosphatase RsbU (regulator of sigma subunit)